MKKVYWYIAAIVLILIYIYFIETLPKGIGFALGAALGYMIGTILWNAIKNRKRNNYGKLL